MKPNREKIEAEDLVKERRPLTKWELTPEGKEDFDRVLRLQVAPASAMGTITTFGTSGEK